MKTKSTIQISRDLKEKLHKMKRAERESFDDVLRRKLEDKKLIDKRLTLGKGT